MMDDNETNAPTITPELLPCPFCGSDAERRDELTKGIEGVSREAELRRQIADELGELRSIQDNLEMALAAIKPNAAAGEEGTE